MSDLIKLESPELAGVEKSKAQQIKATFEPMVKMLEDFEAAYNEVMSASKAGIDQDLTARAKRLRIDIGKVRIQTAKIKDEQKAEYLRAGNAIQGVHNIIVWAVTDKENKLKEIENYFELQEQKRLEKLQADRAEALSPYVEDAHERNLSGMEEDVWQPYFAAKKKEHEDRIAAEKKAEQERIAREKAEALERERIRKENDRLKKEAEERERLAKIEADKRAKEEAARKAREEKERLAREAEARKERERFEARLKAEKEERERVQRELQAKQEAERKAREAEAAMIEAELSKGDAAKVKDLINDLGALTSKYSFKSKKNKKMYVDVCQLIDKVINHIQK